MQSSLVKIRRTALIVAVALAVALSLMSPAQGANQAPAIPDAIVKSTPLGEMNKRVRIMVPRQQRGVVRYSIVTKKTGATIRFCSRAAVAVRYGNTGCFIDTPHAYDGVWYIRAIRGGKRSAPSTALIFAGTTESGVSVLNQFRATRSAAARVAKDARATLKRHAAGCLKDAVVTQALRQLGKMGGRAMRSPNPYVAVGGLAASAISALDRASGVKNRCAAIGAYLSESAKKFAVSFKTQRRVFLISSSDWDTRWADSCAISTGSRTIVTRAAIAGGMRRSDCIHFWAPLAR